MEGVGENFGRAVDAVLRRPRPALVPILVDLAFLLLGSVLFFALARERILFPQGYRLPQFAVAVPHALPTVGDVIGPEPNLDRAPLVVLSAAALLIVLSIPLIAFAEAGFLGVLARVYLQPVDVLFEGRHPDAWSRVRDAFASSGRRHFRAFLLLRSIQALLALAALYLPHALPILGDYTLGILAVDVLLIYAPYATVDRACGALAAIRESVQLVSDHLATTLVALLFGFLLTGGLGLLLARVAALPLWGDAVAGVTLWIGLAYAPVGTALSLFLYLVYRGFRPPENLAQPAPAPEAAGVGA